MRYRKLAVLASIVSVIIVGIGALTAAAATKQTTVTPSPRWSGFVVADAAKRGNMVVQAKFVVPATTCARGHDSQAPIWAGVDGDGVNALWQGGVLLSCVNGRPDNTVFYENFTPGAAGGNAPKLPPGTDGKPVKVQAGDFVQVNICPAQGTASCIDSRTSLAPRSADKWAIQIFVNRGAQQLFSMYGTSAYGSIARKQGVVAGSSAECIAERPTPKGAQPPPFTQFAAFEIGCEIDQPHLGYSQGINISSPPAPYSTRHYDLWSQQYAPGKITVTPLSSTTAWQPIKENSGSFTERWIAAG